MQLQTEFSTLQLSDPKHAILEVNLIMFNEHDGQARNQETPRESKATHSNWFCCSQA